MDKIIEKVCYDFYGSIKDTYNDARKIDKSIEYDDVKKWFEKNQVRQTDLRGFNSFIADHVKQEFQIDLFFVNEDDEFKV